MQPPPDSSLQHEVPFMTTKSHSAQDSVPGDSEKQGTLPIKLTSSKINPPNAPTLLSTGEPGLQELRPDQQQRSTSQKPIRTLESVDSYNDPRQIVIRSFSPRVGVFASADTEAFLGSKGFKKGLWDLLRPFGEKVQGKVVIRDSAGAGRAFEDFGVVFVSLGDVRESTPPLRGEATEPSLRRPLNPRLSLYKQLARDGPQAAIDGVVGYYLKIDDMPEQPDHDGTARHSKYSDRSKAPSPSVPHLYTLYLRKLLASMHMVPQETFAHPVACLIAISSHCAAPIETLRHLYNQSASGAKKLPPWVNSEHLRYYVLVHDEDHDDIAKSTALFDQMKRHFGLHCHLLRLKATPAPLLGRDTTPILSPEWLPAQEELGEIFWHGKSILVSISSSADSFIDTGYELPSSNYIFESDAVAIKAFVRELVTQSIVPFMENRISLWNDQVASRRRGISGRFMSLSKRWTGFSSTRGSLPGIVGVPNASGSNFDPDNGFYTSDTPEAAMRQLADYAFMLRDWNLAYSTYELLRTDYGQDKAWIYHAAASEMAGICLLLMPHTLSTRSRSETIDQLLESASYSYLTRCGMPYGVIRCLTLATELLRSRGSAFAGEAARWGSRLLELGVVSPVIQAFLSERIAECYQSRIGAGTNGWGSRLRQAALWNVLAADTWRRVGHKTRAQACLRQASDLYGGIRKQNTMVPLPSMQIFWNTMENFMRPDDDSSQHPFLGTEEINSDLISFETNAREAPESPARSRRHGSATSHIINNPRHELDGFE